MLGLSGLGWMWGSASGGGFRAVLRSWRTFSISVSCALMSFWVSVFCALSSFRRAFLGLLVFCVRGGCFVGSFYKVDRCGVGEVVVCICCCCPGLHVLEESDTEVAVLRVGAFAEV